MPTPHKHAEVMKAWADDTSRIIQFKETQTGEWVESVMPPQWYSHIEYRIKPDPRAERDMAIAEAVRDEILPMIVEPALVSHVRNNIRMLDLPAIIASVKD